MFSLIRHRLCSTVAMSSELKQTYARITSHRMQKEPMTPRQVSLLYSVVLDSPMINDFNEKFLSLTLSLVLNPRNFPQQLSEESDLVIESLVKRVMASGGLTLQGCNQILGAFAKLKTARPEIEISRFAHFLKNILDEFRTKFQKNCPNRELSNIFWAAHVLHLDNADEVLANSGRSVAQVLQSMDCVDLSLICAGLVDSPASDFWPVVRSELLSRGKFTAKDIPSIMCSLACAGINDRELILHLCSAVVKDDLLNAKNIAPIVWAIATCDFVHSTVFERAVVIIQDQGHLIRDPMDVRRISRAFAVTGKLDRIEKWLLEKLLNSSSTSKGGPIDDSVVVWEMVTNRLFESAFKFFRSKPIGEWRKIASISSSNASQIYHLFLASLVGESLKLNSGELAFLNSLQPAFSQTTDDMSSSVLHRQSSDALRELGLEHVSEYKEPVSGFVIDSFIPSLNIGLEVQGPTHFITHLQSEAVLLRPADRFKHEVLRRVTSMRIVQATPWNFGPKLRKKNKLLMKAILDSNETRRH